MATCIRCRMHTIHSQWLNFIPDGVISRNSDPHLPILCTNKTAIESAQFFIDLAPDDDRGGHDPLFGSKSFQPVIKNATSHLLEWREISPMTLFIHENLT